MSLAGDRPRRQDRAASADRLASVVRLFVPALVLSGCLGGTSPPVDWDFEGHDHALPPEAMVARESLDGRRVGILLRDHGEIVEYNISTYGSIRDFILDLWPYMGFPDQLLEVDQGTYLIDVAHPFDGVPAVRPALRDAWTQPFDGDAAPVADPLSTIAAQALLPGRTVYLTNGQAVRPPDWYANEALTEGTFYFTNDDELIGYREPDVLELFALATYRDWLKMENHSPRYEQGLLLYPYLEARLREYLGDDIVVAVAHGIDPKMDPAETLASAARRLVEAEVDLVVDAYQSSVHSDVMDTCMMWPHAEHALHDAGFHGKIVRAGQAGLDNRWAQGTADFAEFRAASLPAYGRLSIYLVQHGAEPGSSNPCGVGPDQYHANAAAQFALAKAALERTVTREGLVIRHVYAQGANATEDGMLSPWEALDLDERHATSQVLVIPYEFWGDGLDDLVNLRESLGLRAPEPYYDAAHESTFDFDGMGVTVTSGYFSPGAKADAYVAQILAAIVEA